MSYLLVAALCIVCTTLAAPAPATPEFWWHNACSSPSKTRHLRHTKPQETAIKRVKTLYELEVKPYLDYLVEGNHFTMKEILPTLPKKPKLKNKKALYKQLATYAATIHELIGMDVDNGDGKFDTKLREETLNNLKYELKELICEVQQSGVFAKKGSMPHHTPKSLLQKSGGITDVILQDYAVLSRYGVFIHNYFKMVHRAEDKTKKRKPAGENQKKEPKTPKKPALKPTLKPAVKRTVKPIAKNTVKTTKRPKKKKV